jgi:hypothetical protein
MLRFTSLQNLNINSVHSRLQKKRQILQNFKFWKFVLFIMPKIYKIVFFISLEYNEFRLFILIFF